METNNPTKSVSWENQIVTGLKILLFIASLFILWSFLALISSIYHPFASLDNLFAGQIAPKTLADSLFGEIVEAYFSFFTIISLGFNLASGYIGYQRAKEISSRFFTFFTRQKPIRVLLNRILTNKNPQVFQLHNEDIRKLNKTRESIYGPAVIQLDDPLVLMASDNKQDFRVLSPTDKKQIVVAPVERIIKFIDPGTKIFRAMVKDSALRDNALNIHLEYRLRIPRQEEQRANSYWISIFNTEPQKMLDLIDSLIQSELSVFMKSKSIVQNDFGQGIDIEANLQGFKGIHKKYIHSTHRAFIKKQNPPFFRNRKRLMSHIGSSIVSSLDIGSRREGTDAKFSQWMNEFNSQLKISLFTLFGYNPIEIISYQFGEQ